jgi:hypothetical protein
MDESKRLRLSFEFLLENYRQRELELRQQIAHLRQISQLATLLSGGLVGLFSKFGLELLGENAERSFLLLLMALLYVGLMWGTLEQHYNIALLGEYVEEHLCTSIRLITRASGSEGHLPPDWQTFWREQYFESGIRATMLNALTTIGGYALVALPVLVLWAAFLVLQHEHSGLAWGSLSWPAQALGILNLICGLLTLPLIYRAVRAYKPKGH